MQPNMVYLISANLDFSTKITNFYEVDNWEWLELKTMLRSCFEE